MKFVSSYFELVESWDSWLEWNHLFVMISQGMLLCPNNVGRRGSGSQYHKWLISWSTAVPAIPKFLRDCIKRRSKYIIWWYSRTENSFHQHHTCVWPYLKKINIKEVRKTFFWAIHNLFTSETSKLRSYGTLYPWKRIHSLEYFQ